MKESTRLKKHDEMLAQLLGITVEEVRAKRDADEADSKFREAQAIHLFLEKPDAFISKNCQECHGHFLTTYRFVSICSTRCMTKSLEKIGIDWNPLRTSEERWKRAAIPIAYVIPPLALETLLRLAQIQENSPLPVDDVSQVEDQLVNNAFQADLDSALHGSEFVDSWDDT